MDVCLKAEVTSLSSRPKATNRRTVCIIISFFTYGLPSWKTASFVQSQICTVHTCAHRSEALSVLYKLASFLLQNFILFTTQCD